MLRHPLMRRRLDNWELQHSIEIAVSRGWLDIGIPTGEMWTAVEGVRCTGYVENLGSLEADRSQKIQVICQAAEILWSQGRRTVVKGNFTFSWASSSVI